MINKKSFTLVEILLALAILGVGLVGILSIFVVGANTIRRTVELTEASLVAQIVFEDFKRQGHASPGSLAVPALPSCYTNLNYLVSMSVPAPVGSSNLNLWRVDMAVNKGTRQIAQFTTYITRL